MELKLIGEWFSLRFPDFPNPTYFVNNKWSKEEQEKVISYLKKGKRVDSFLSREWCRFDCNCEEDLDSLIRYTDGVYIWVGSLVHYIEVHNVVPPKEFISHVMSMREEVDFNVEIDENFDIDIEWWKEQKGEYESGILTYIDLSLKEYK